MLVQLLSRRRFLLLSALALGGRLLVGRKALALGREKLRVGVVIPTETGASAGEAYADARVGESALLGAHMADEDVSASSKPEAIGLQVLIASAPDTDAAVRAAERLIITEGVAALVGGIGVDQATALNAAAKLHALPFFNIGSAHEALREQLFSRYTFHVEASASMYIDALVQWLIQAKLRRCFFVQADTPESESHYQKAVQTIKRYGLEHPKIVCDRVVVGASPLVFTDVIEQIGVSKVDVIILLLDAESQLVFLGQYDASQLEAQVTGFPTPITQTREFYKAVHDTASRMDSGFHLALWESTLKQHGARNLNERFLGRWGKAMDATAWATYVAIKIFYGAAVGNQNTEALIAYLENPKTVLDVYKGPRVTFRQQDHQLQQPLYVVKPNEHATTLLELTTLIGEFTEPGAR